MSTPLPETAGLPVSPEDARRRSDWHRLLRLNPLAIVAAAIILIVIVGVTLADLIAPYDPLAQDHTAILQAPSVLHWLGTDTLGRDTFSRVLHGGRPALLGVAAAVLIFTLSGLLFGLLAGYLGGWVDKAVSILVDIILSLPGIIIVLAVLAVFSQNLFAAMITFGFLLSSSLIRVVRGSVFAIREELYVAAAEIAGLRSIRIMLRHVLPGVAGPVIVQVAIFAGGALGLQTGLGFLGLASTPPAPSWGGMVGEAAPVMFQSPYLLLFSGGLIALMILAFALVGDGIRDINEGRTGGTRAKRRVRGGSAHDEVQQSVQPLGEGVLLQVEDFAISFEGEPVREVVHGIDFEISRGEIVGLVGESGSGKTITGLSLLGLLPETAFVSRGTARLGDVVLTDARAETAQAVRGTRIGLVSQEPMVALDPLFTVGAQMDEVLKGLTDLSRGDRRIRAAELLRSVGLTDTDRVLRSFPHEMSGGMLQRIVIAIALAGDPELIIADEPTTALDVTVQAGILDLLRRLRDERGLTVLLITHDLAVVADLCDRVLVMQHGTIVEQRQVRELFAAAQHPYTRALIASTPSLVELPS